MRAGWSVRLAAGAGLAVWAAVIVTPLALLFVSCLTAADPEWSNERLVSLTLKSFAWAAGIGATSVLLGFLPGVLVGSTRRGGLAFVLLLAPLLLPRYVVYYAWWLLLSPTTALGRLLAEDAAVARFAHGLTAGGALVLWTWPLAALLIAQGWRALDRDVLRSARVDAAAPQRLLRVTLPLMARSLLLAFAVCFVLVLSELGTFDLAGIETLGTKIGLEMAARYQATGSAGAAARAGAPLAVAAVLVGVALRKRLRDVASRPPLEAPARGGAAWQWAVVLVLVGFSLVAPLVLLVAHVTDAGPYRDFWQVHGDEIAWTGLTAVGAGVVGLVIAGGVLLAERLGRFGRAVAAVAYPTIFLAMFLPGSLIGVAMLWAASAVSLPDAVRNEWPIVALGQAARFAGIALIVLQAARDAADRRLGEMASVDGATGLQAARYVHFARLWPTALAAFVLVAMFGMTELSATMVLLPAGVPNFAQSLLNQMHYVRDQQVIASCLALVATYAVLAIAVGVLVWLWRRRSAGVLLLVLAVAVAGCGSDAPHREPDVAFAFGSTGRGDGEFIYPRAIARGAGETFHVVDKTGRIQQFSRKGERLGGFRLPEIEKGKPTGLTVGPDGNLYVADTHYHRVLVYTPQGKLVRQFGRFGEGDGEFIYPTDEEFAGDGRIFVSEYGGNDRVNMFDRDGRFLGSFGSNGSGAGEFARPAALCVDRTQGVLYVADACNHRIARYNLQGQLLGYIGSAGGQLGRLRYPYDLALAADGTLFVCEFGNNRLQWFTAAGEAVATAGGPGRELGKLAYPWGVALDDAGRAYVVDAGNNRVQVWRP